MDVKIEKLCQALSVIEILPETDADLNAAHYAALAIGLLRSYDALAEFTEHAPGCKVIFVDAIGQRFPNCICGLAEAQRKVADILEGL